MWIHLIVSGLEVDLLLHFCITMGSCIHMVRIVLKCTHILRCKQNLINHILCKETCLCMVYAQIYKYAHLINETELFLIFQVLISSWLSARLAYLVLCHNGDVNCILLRMEHFFFHVLSPTLVETIFSFHFIPFQTFFFFGHPCR